MPRNVEGPASGRNTIGRILRLWSLVELDFAQVYGIDLGEPGLLDRRSWRWITLRLHGLLSTKSRVQRVLNPTPEQRKADARRTA